MFIRRLNTGQLRSGLSIRTLCKARQAGENSMATEVKRGAQAELEGKSSSEDPLTSRLISEHRGLEKLFQQYEQLPPDTDPKVLLSRCCSKWS